MCPPPPPLPSSYIISLVIPSIPWTLCLFILFMALSTSSSVNSSISFVSGSSHASDLKIGTPVATLPGAWRYSVSAGTGRPGVSIL